MIKREYNDYFICDMDFRELKTKVLEKTPILKKTLEHKGDATLLNYFEENRALACHVSIERQNELLSIIKKMITETLEPSLADSTIEELRNHYYASTADHHGPITHPFFVNSHLAQSYANKKHQLTNIFVFSCGGISLNNSSHPRGILFHDEKLTQQRVNFVSLKHRQHPVYSFSAYTKNDIEKKWSTRTNIKKLQELIKEVYENTKILNLSTYTEQITYSNYLLWKKIPGQEKTNLIYLEQEEIVNQLLIEFHLTQGTIISKLLTDETFLQIFEKYFDGIHGAFSLKEKRGTVLFWAIHEGKRKQLIREKNTLRTSDGAYHIKLSASELRNALEKKELMPSMALSFIVLSFYYGLNCGGGFLQVNYLTYMKEAYIHFLRDIGMTEEIQAVERVMTEYFCGEFVLARIGNQNHVAHASSIDLILYGKKDTDNRLQELAGICTLAHAVDAMMPRFYHILYGEPTPIEPPLPVYPPSIYV